MVQKHVQAVHRKEKPYECDICQTRLVKFLPQKFGIMIQLDLVSIRFSQKSHMQKHVMTVHMKEKPYKCKQCTFQTSTYATLGKHMSLVHKVRVAKQKYHN